MRFSARVFFRCISFILLFAVLLPIFSSSVFAQTTQPILPQAPTFAQPNVEANVPQNQHTFVQAIFIEMLLAIQCQLTGIDMSNPTQSCLGVNLTTNKIGYAPTNPSQDGQIAIGGILGMVNSGIATMYTPTFGTGDYTRYLSQNFGIAKPAVAATAYTGYDGLSIVLDLWKTTRDIAYFLLVIAFIFIGIGVMLRLRIDPRTVMTIQNQIPRVIICIILITFSYAIAAAMIDIMWSATYMGINKLTQAANPTLTNCSKDTPTGLKLDYYATQYILDDPFTYANKIFLNQCGGDKNNPTTSGILELSKDVGNSITAFEAGLVLNILGLNPDLSCNILHFADCPGAALVGIVKWIASWMWVIVIVITLIITLFRIWFELLKAYVMLLIYVILAPIMIVFGLLPKRPLGFEKWLRVYFANLAIFPAVAFILVAARVFHDLFNKTGTFRFVPPLVGNPDLAGFGGFGVIIEFGMILMAPQLLSIIREKIGAPPLKQVGAAAATFTAGRAAAGAPAKQAMKHWNKRDQYGNAVGPLANLTDRATTWTSKKAQHIPLGIGGIIKTGHEKKEYMKQNYNSIAGFDTAKKNFTEARAAAPDKKKFDEAFPDISTHKHATSGRNDSGLPPHLRDPNNNGTENQEGATAAGEKPTIVVPPGGATTPTAGAHPPTGTGDADAAGGDSPASPAPTKATIALHLQLPNGSEEIPLAGGEQQITREVVLNKIPADRRQSFTDHVQREAGSDTNHPWNKPHEELTQEDHSVLQQSLDSWSHVSEDASKNPPEGEGGTGTQGA